jgi:hypothetical protein
MAFFALIKSNVVTGVIVADQSFVDATPIEAFDADIVIEVLDAPGRPGPGYTYDPGTGLFTSPE